MKMVVAIIRPEKLEAVQAALNERDVYLMTVSDVRGCGRQRGYTEVYRGTEFQVRLLPKLKLEIAVNDAFVDATIEAVVHARGRRRPGRSAMGRFSFCRWRIAFAFGPGNGERKRLVPEGRLRLSTPLLTRKRRVSPGGEDKPRLPVRQKSHCEALVGAADPVTADSNKCNASAQEGGQCRFPAIPAHSGTQLSSCRSRLTRVKAGGDIATHSSASRAKIVWAENCRVELFGGGDKTNV